MSYYIGQKLRMIPNAHVDKLGYLLMEKDYPCKVVYVHNEHRYFTVEFEFPGGKIRESYKFAEDKDLACNLKVGNKWYG